MRDSSKIIVCIRVKYIIYTEFLESASTLKFIFKNLNLSSKDHQCIEIIYNIVNFGSINLTIKTYHFF